MRRPRSHPTTQQFASAILSSILTVGLSIGVSTASHAQTSDADDSSSDASDAEPAAADASKKTETQTEGQEAAEDANQQQNPNLAPGGVVTGTSSFPLHLNASITNSLGIGTFSPGYTNNPMWSTGISIAPVAILPTFGLYDKPVILSGRIGVDVTNWLSANTDIETHVAVPRLSDVSAQIVLPGLFREPVTGISVTPIVQARLPLSVASWQANVMFSAAGAALVAYNGTTEFGTFTVQYVPSARYTHHHTAGPTRKCSDYIAGSRNTNPWGSPSANLGDVPESVICRDEEKLPDGRSIVPGRQIMGTVSNSGTLAYTTPKGAHNFALSLGHILAFQRPLTSQPDLSSLYASNQAFSEFTSGSLSYTYTVPIDLQLFLTAGISTFGPAMDPKGYLRFPLFDFYTPQSNLTSGFFTIATSI